MEQVIKCTNDSNKNAVRLCDDCSSPFCAECLRKDLLGLYYCQWCYPAIFKDTSAPEHEIPIDDLLLTNNINLIQISRKNSDQNYIIKQIFKGGVYGLIITTIIFILFFISVVLFANLSNFSHPENAGFMFFFFIPVILIGIFLGAFVGLCYALYTEYSKSF